MGFFDRLTKHEALFRGMNDRLGVDVSSWVANSPEQAASYRSALLSCTSCKDAGACQQWQADHVHADHTPNYCRNKRMLDALAKA